MALSNAEKQRAYRRRKAEAVTRGNVTIAEELQRLREKSNAGNVTIIEEVQRLREEVTLLRALPSGSPNGSLRKGFPLDSLPKESPSLTLPTLITNHQFALANGHADARPVVFAKEFDEWWKAYPHKVGKIAALKAFQKVRRSNVPLEGLLDGLERYVESKPEDRPWCNPATWLNQGRWQDEFSEPGTSESSEDQVRRPEPTPEEIERVRKELEIKYG